MKRFAYLVLLAITVIGCSEEEVKIDISNCTYSRTLPVLFINTEGNKPIVSKEEYLNATYYLETFDLDDYEPIGSETEQLPLEIRGRGNFSWKKDKKPYRLKLGSKAAPLGMDKSKHFVLLAHVGAYSQYLTETAAFKLGEEIGLAWTPKAEPVEVVVNNEYKGLYFLVENIRVDDKRVDITEQDDNCTNTDEITGGWLLEIDNYNDPDQIKFVNGSGYTMHITHKSPEILSEEQESYLRQQMKAIDDAVYEDDKNSTTWEKYIDIDALTRYYIIQEIFCNGDAFAGSSYFHKDRGNGYLAPSGTSEIHSRAAPATSSMKKGKDLAVGLQKSPNIHVSKNIYAKYGTSSILPSTNRYTPLSMKWLNVVPKPTNATPNAGRNITKVTRKTKKDGSQKFYKTA